MGSEFNQYLFGIVGTVASTTLVSYTYNMKKFSFKNRYLNDCMERGDDNKLADANQLPTIRISK